MCGVGGFQGSFDAGLLSAMTASLRHRGPDDRGTFHDSSSATGLAHTRLTIIDLTAAGHQPMVYPPTGAVITFNGEIYNYRELRAELEREGFEFRSTSDTEVLLALHARDGLDMLPQLNGIFAFALFDPRDRTVLVARDGAGVKPLYYAETSRGVLYASELKALLLDDSVSHDLDPVAIREYLRFLWCPAPRTMLRGVRKLEPGCAMLIRGGRVARRWRFYHLPYDQPIDESARPQEVTEQLRQHLARAVHRQMVADVPVGAFLSGGLDSSSIAAYARLDSSSMRLPCFTLESMEGTEAEGFPDDLPYARTVAKHLGVDLDVIRVKVPSADDLESMVYWLDEPQADLAALAVRQIALGARERGIKVLLSGAGGDDIFTGYRRHVALAAERYWRWLPHSAKRGLRLAAIRAAARSPLRRRFERAFRHADSEDNERIAGYFEWLPPGGAESLLRRELREEAGTNPLVAALNDLPANTPLINRMLALDTRFFLADHNLNYTDKLAMSVGVEVRVPFLDPELMSFAARLPVSYKQRGRTGKWILKRAMEPLLPANVIYRPKAGFGVPLRTWLDGPMRPLVDDLLSPASLRRGGVFDSDSVARLATETKKGSVDGTYPLLAVMCVELWRRSFLGRTRGGQRAVERTQVT